VISEPSRNDVGRVARFKCTRRSRQYASAATKYFHTREMPNTDGFETRHFVKLAACVKTLEPATFRNKTI